MKRRERDDAGITITEFVIAMAIFSFVLLAFAASVRFMASSAIRVQSVADTSTQARQAVDRLSRQLAYASAVNLPARYTPTDLPGQGLSWYLELLTEAVPNGGAARCNQWRLLPVTQELQTRSWDIVSYTPSAWVTVAKPVVNLGTDATQQPFAVRHTDTTFTLVRVFVDLRIKNGQGPVLQSQGQYAVRNSVSNGAPPSANGVCARPATGVVDR